MQGVRCNENLNYTVMLEDPCNNVKHRDRNHKTKKNDSFPISINFYSMGNK